MIKKMKIIIAVLSMISIELFAASDKVELRSAKIDSHDIKSLQNGARMFVDYCQGCHSLKYHRYNRLKDLDLTEEEIEKNLMFAAEDKNRIGDTVGRGMPVQDAVRWFGNDPPDLSLIARSRGPDWLFTYLTSFYVDKSKHIGVNNLIFKDVGMPFVLAGLQGEQELLVDKKRKRLRLKKQGSMGKAEYEKHVNDLVNFLAYVADPVKNERERFGIFFIGLLLVFLIFSYLLKKEYWKDIQR